MTTSPDFTEHDSPKTVAMEANMIAAGLATHEAVEPDFFGVCETYVFTIPGSTQTVTHQVLNEGARRKYLASINRDVKVQKSTGDAIMKLQPGEEKAALLNAAVVGWTLKRGGTAVPFSPKELEKFLTAAPPKVIDQIHADVQKYNDWLLGDANPEDVQVEIDRLTEIKEKLVKEAEGKVAS